MREYQNQDLEALYEVCLRTGDSGKDARDKYNDKRMLGNLYLAPYTEFAPQYCLSLVNETNQSICGYCIGVLDTLSFHTFFINIWRPKIKDLYKESTNSLNSKDKEILFKILNDPLTIPKDLEPYPSHLHIDLLPEAQGKGLGKDLIHKLLEKFKSNGSTGVHLGVSNVNYRAIKFYIKLGFVKLLESDHGLTLVKKL